MKKLGKFFESTTTFKLKMLVALVVCAGLMTISCDKKPKPGGGTGGGLVVDVSDNQVKYNNTLYTVTAQNVTKTDVPNPDWDMHVANFSCQLPSGQNGGNVGIVFLTRKNTALDGTYNYSTTPAVGTINAVECSLGGNTILLGDSIRTATLVVAGGKYTFKIVDMNNNVIQGIYNPNPGGGGGGDSIPNPAVNKLKYDGRNFTVAVTGAYFYGYLDANRWIYTIYVIAGTQENPSGIELYLVDQPNVQFPASGRTYTYNSTSGEIGTMPWVYHLFDGIDNKEEGAAVQSATATVSSKNGVIKCTFNITTLQGKKIEGSCEAVFEEDEAISSKSFSKRFGNMFYKR